MINIGDNIKKFRELKNITREHMAHALEMSLSGYGKIERGETELTVSKLEKVAEILGVHLAQLLNFDASQIFNIHGNQTVQGIGAKADHMYFHGDEYREKYIKILEEENQRLKEQLKQLGKY